jgi:hypothetical protein
MAINVFPPASSGAVSKVLKEKYFRTDGTWDYPTSSAFDGEVEVTVVAGGGGSGSALSRANVSGIAFTGGGGGGQVISKEKFSVLGLGNQTVKVGLGGSSFSQSGGLFGGYSSFGNDEVANFYTDPALADGLVLGGNTNTATYFDTLDNGQFHLNITYSPSTTYDGGTNPPLPPVGNTFVTINTTINYPITGEYVRVEPSTSYKIGASYHRNSTTGVVITPSMFWYTEAGVHISTSTLTSYTTLSTTGTWDEVVSTVSSPSTAYYGRLVWVCTSGGANFRITGVFVTKTSSGIDTVKSGYSAGYKWTGQPNSSFTVAENASLLIAQGGGGGWGVGAHATGSGSMFNIPGQTGYTSGGKHLWHTNTTIADTNQIFGGPGGGAGGSAIAPQLFSAMAGPSATSVNLLTSSYAATDNPNGAFSWWHIVRDVSVSGGKGGYGISVTNPGGSPDARFPFHHHGGPGEGIDGFGIGGFAFFSSASNHGSRTLNPIGSKQYVINREQSYNSTAPSSNYYNNGLQNSGNGANGLRRTLNTSNIFQNGHRGGSGIVIVRWYE